MPIASIVLPIQSPGSSAISTERTMPGSLVAMFLLSLLQHPDDMNLYVRRLIW